MKKELARSSKRLRAPGHPKPYFISYLLRDSETILMVACYGAMCQDRREHRRNCFADVRVGTYAYDNSLMGGLSIPPEESESRDLIDMPIEDDEDALRFGLWRLTDACYREAVRDYHIRKSRDVSYLDQNKRMPSFLPQHSGRHHASPLDMSLDLDKMRTYLRKSSAWLKEFPEIKNSSVEFTAALRTKIFVSSEGVERVWHQPVLSLSAYMWLHTKKTDLDVCVAINTASLDELPSLAAFRKIIRCKVDELYASEAGDTITSYSGPVLLAPRPAGLFLHEVVGHRLEGSRLLSDDEGKTFKDKVGVKIMHEGLTIADDPRITHHDGVSLIGHYPCDDEGIPAQRALLVEDGVLKGFLTTRSPIRKGMTQSNGHARNQSDERPISRMGNLMVTSKEGQSFAQLKRLLIAEIKKQKLSFGIVLYEVEGGETGTEAYNFQAFLGQITKAAKLYPDGREKPIKGVDFVGTPLASLSHIVAVGDTLEVDNGFCGAESGTVPVSTISPALLLSSLELQAKESSVITPYALPLPWHDKPRGRK